jgi:hypothetical protein
MRKLSVRVDGIDGMLLGPLDALGDDLHPMTRLYLTLAYAQFAAEHELIEAVRLPTDKPGVSTIAIRV